VDGWGGWRDDRQLDPVAGDTTDRPAGLTSGRAYAGPGADRLALVGDLLGTAAGAPPADLAQAPELLALFEAPGVSGHAEFDERGVAVTLVDEGGADGRRMEWLLDARPFRVPPTASLRYGRTSASLALDLVFADGQRLLAEAPATADRSVVVDLAPFAGRRVEEVALVAFAGGARWQGRIDGVRLGP
ncbi:MAG: hypothetical protein KC613_27045, partial [Myxococcales bacterium]|nr:hypothetical protein [Myxococcales bacterium]